jgi:hypothetical protein
VVTKLFDEAQVEGMLGNMARLADLMGEVRAKEAQAKMDFEKAQNNLNAVSQARTIDIASSPEMAEIVDPRTGRSNEKWANIMVEEKLRADPEFGKALASFGNAQKALYEAQVEVFNVSDKLGMAKASANLLAAYMGLAKGG